MESADVDLGRTDGAEQQHSPGLPVSASCESGRSWWPHDTVIHHLDIDIVVVWTLETRRQPPPGSNSHPAERGTAGPPPPAPQSRHQDSGCRSTQERLQRVLGTDKETGGSLEVTDSDLQFGAKLLIIQISRPVCLVMNQQ